MDDPQLSRDPIMALQGIITRTGRLRPGAIFLPLLGLMVALWGLTGCGEKIEPLMDEQANEGVPAVPAPLIHRDLAEIHRSGILRVVTYYSPRTYFIHKGGQAGFEFDLVSRFAEQENLTVEMVIAENGDDLVSLLNEGQGDIVCVGRPVQDDQRRFIAWTRPTNFTRKVVVLPADNSRPPGIVGLAGLTLTLPWGNTFHSTLEEIRGASGVAFRITLGPPLAQAEELMAEVAHHEREAVVVDDITARAGMAWINDLRLGPVLGERRPTTWLLRNNSPDLLSALDAFLENQLKVGATGRVRRSQIYGIIYDRYFENALTIRDYREPAFRPDKSGRISIFDDLVRNQAEAVGLDWRLVSALIYQESRFYPNALSKADARGLMQVLPKFAGPQADSLFTPDANLRAGLRIMDQTYRGFAYLDSLDRWRFTLAVYHAGAGHVTDARRLAMDLGRNPNSWEGSLAATLPRLMERRHYRDTRHGYYGGAETVDYVEEIINRFRMYARFVPRFPVPLDSPESVEELLDKMDWNPGLPLDEPPPR